jgi:hypothetical protein
MLKRIPFVFFMLCVAVATCGAYTVVMKNGKTMTGTLISETDQTLIFKDDAGIQYSLKKSNLDLDKMSQANAPKVEAPPPIPPAAPSSAPEPPKKKVRVYTKDDVDALRAKYPELSLGEPVENPEDFEGGVLKPSAYGKRIEQGAATVGNSLATLAELRDGVATAWEVAASTGKNPADAVNAVLTGEKGTEIMKGVSDDLNTLGRWQETMTSPPEALKGNYDLFVQALTGLSDYQRALRQWNTFENVNLFRSRLGDLQNQITSAVTQIQASAPPAQPQAAPAEPGSEENTEDQQQPPTP